jgi:hypothetical protein
MPVSQTAVYSAQLYGRPRSTAAGGCQLRASVDSAHLYGCWREAGVRCQNEAEEIYVDSVIAIQIHRVEQPKSKLRPFPEREGRCHKIANQTPNIARCKAPATIQPSQEVSLQSEEPPQGNKRRSRLKGTSEEATAGGHRDCRTRTGARRAEPSRAEPSRADPRSLRLPKDEDPQRAQGVKALDVLSKETLVLCPESERGERASPFVVPEGPQGAPKAEARL